MTEDVLYIQDKDWSIAQSLSKYILKIRKKKMIVCISGASGSGKSVLSYCLAKLLIDHQIVAKILHLDDFYKIIPKKRMEWRKKNGIQHVGLNEYDWELIEKISSQYINNEKAVMPSIDLINQNVDQLIVDFKPIELLIIDGLYAIHHPFSDLNIFIETDLDKIAFSQSIRHKEKFDNFRKKIIKRESEEVDRLREKADIIVDKNFESFSILKQ